MDAAEVIAAQARALFGNLPAGAIDEDEPLGFTIDRGALVVVVERTRAMYHLCQGQTIRVQMVGGGLELSAWHNGHATELRVMTADELKARIATLAND